MAATDIWANATIDFLTPYSITFPEMYSLANPQKYIVNLTNGIDECANLNVSLHSLTLLPT